VPSEQNEQFQNLDLFRPRVEIWGDIYSDALVRKSNSQTLSPNEIIRNEINFSSCRGNNVAKPPGPVAVNVAFWRTQSTR
jgi:hypothetical protein